MPDELPPDPDSEGLIPIPDIPQPSQDKNSALDAIDAGATTSDLPYEEASP